MRVYFVRHGESVGNANTGDRSMELDQSDMLTELGWEQVRWLGHRLQNEGLTHIITSPMQRAAQTTEGINETLGLPVETNDDLFEIRASSNYYIVPADERINYAPHHVMLAHDDDWDYVLDGSESFNQGRQRVARFQDYLAKTVTDRQVLVVTHGDFIRFFLGLALFGDSFSPRNFEQLWNLKTANTGISIFEYEDQPRPAGYKPRYWQLVTWMDGAHLGTELLTERSR